MRIDVIMASHLILELVLVGDLKTGKTSVLQRFVNNAFRDWPETKNINFENKDVGIGGNEVNLQLWDTCGQERFWKIMLPLFHDANGFMLLYNTSHRESFSLLPQKKMEIDNCTRGRVPMVLVGHMFHGAERVVSKEEGKQMAAQIGVPFFEVCAKTREDIDKAFTTLATLALDYHLQMHPEFLTKELMEKKLMRQRLSERRSHAADLKMENSRLASLKEKLRKEIKEIYTHEKGTQERTKKQSKRSKALQKCYEKNYGRVQRVIEELAEVKSREHALGQELRFWQGRVAVLVQNVEHVEGRVAELEHQQMRADETVRYPTLSGQHHWVVQREEIELTEEELGRGGWATVCVAKFRGLKVAAKCMQNLIVSDYNRQLFSREMSIAATACHPNLIQFIGATIEGKPIILTELMSTSLRAKLERQPLSPDQISSISLDVARALLYLHLMQPDPIIHRDISSANVLLNPGPNNSWLAKVSDYGSANYRRQVTTQGPGNPSYAAPEANVPFRQTPKMDVYSYGVLLLEMWTRQFPEKSKHRTMQQGLEREVKKMVQWCLEKDPHQRPGMRDVMEQL